MRQSEPQITRPTAIIPVYGATAAQDCNPIFSMINIQKLNPVDENELNKFYANYKIDETALSQHGANLQILALAIVHNNSVKEILTKCKEFLIYTLHLSKIDYINLENDYVPKL
jgi:hypothetical protein